ncbi:MAG: putative serine/threonine-protein kinase Nek2 [Streblomastix strix]|uniref:Putative serine/threonine-protein kinase Nek2 n=1 Tax=Streblomastix strix TaxID=222440 RepID=A0A5J4VLE2_9EUKA|nr:MAG: putative serine/threonine-protein kinase Nek2 [Streblomastix strix]
MLEIIAKKAKEAEEHRKIEQEQEMAQQLEIQKEEERQQAQIREIEREQAEERRRTEEAAIAEQMRIRQQQMATKVENEDDRAKRLLKELGMEDFLDQTISSRLRTSKKGKKKKKLDENSYERCQLGNRGCAEVNGLQESEDQFTTYHIMQNEFSFSAKVISETEYDWVEWGTAEYIQQQDLECTFIQQYYAVKPQNDFIIILSNYCNLGNLREMLDTQNSRIPNTVIMCIIFQILIGLEKLHRIQVVHRGIRPETIRLHNQQDTEWVYANISDFSLSKILGRNEASDIIQGTPNYMAPELLDNQEHGCKVDIWSVGCLMYHLLTKKIPFTARSVVEFKNAIKMPLERPAESNDACWDLLQEMIQVDPEKRISAEQALKHKYFQPLAAQIKLKKRQQSTIGQQEINQNKECAFPIEAQILHIDSVLPLLGRVPTSKAPPEKEQIQHPPIVSIQQAPFGSQLMRQTAPVSFQPSQQPQIANQLSRQLPQFAPIRSQPSIVQQNIQPLTPAYQPAFLQPSFQPSNFQPGFPLSNQAPPNLSFPPVSTKQEVVEY